jgi:hypothetical protein
VIVVIVLTGGLMTTKTTDKDNKTQKEGVVTLPTLPTNFVKKGRTFISEIGSQYPDMWITVDPTRRCEFTIKDAGVGDKLQIKFQFSNGLESQWILDQSHGSRGSARWAKTFRVKTREGSATLVVKCH